jgi:hypothetical protein
MIAVAQAWRPLESTLVAPHETADAEWGRTPCLSAWRRFVGGDGARPGARGSCGKIGWRLEHASVERGGKEQRSMMRFLMLIGEGSDLTKLTSEFGRW